jgi:hypothetical protein
VGPTTTATSDTLSLRNKPLLQERTMIQIQRAHTSNFAFTNELTTRPPTSGGLGQQGPVNLTDGMDSPPKPVAAGLGLVGAAVAGWLLNELVDAVTEDTMSGPKELVKMAAGQGKPHDPPQAGTTQPTDGASGSNGGTGGATGQSGGTSGQSSSSGQAASS